MTARPAPEWCAGGRWTTNSQIVLNVIVNLIILRVAGTFTRCLLGLLDDAALVGAPRSFPS